MTLTGERFVAWERDVHRSKLVLVLRGPLPDFAALVRSSRGAASQSGDCHVRFDCFFADPSSWSALRMGEADSGADSEAEEVDQKRPSRELATASSQS